MQFTERAESESRQRPPMWRRRFGSGIPGITDRLRPKGGFHQNLTAGKRITSVLDAIKEKGDDLAVDDVLYRGYGNVWCVEAGGRHRESDVREEGSSRHLKN